MGILRLLVIGVLVYLGYRLYVSLASRVLPAAEKQPRQGAAERAPHEVLGVAPNASREEVRAAYQKLIQQYHPDRIADMGPELRELAEHHTKELNAAYDAMKSR
jgi:DnaJ-domain-containing protein 1